MKPFMDDDFLLSSPTAKTLYNAFAKDMPIIDYHCHIDPSEIALDRKFETITQAWLGGDHYKWRLMRANGVDEHFITGTAPDRDKFQKFAEALPKAAGHPLYHWTHLELKRYFNCNLMINKDTADDIWRLTGEALPGLSVRDIISKSNVTAIATTDDPVDSLEWHQKIKADPGCAVTVVPCWRPDQAVNLDKPTFAAYIQKLSAAAGMNIATMDDLCAALSARMDFFGEAGCRAADHGLDYVVFNPIAGSESAFGKALSGQTVSREEAEAYKTALMVFFGKEYARRGWVMQLHYGALRNNNTAMFQKIGPDTGFDCIALTAGNRGISRFLDALEQTGELPKTILYSLNPSDNAMLASLIGCFQGTGTAGKIQHGAAWWFNDTKPGMEDQLRTLATQSILGNFVGMLTDSRSFLSYTRHEYFRRILCNLLGGWVENGEYPNDMAALEELVKDICYHNALRYFGFDRTE